MSRVKTHKLTDLKPVRELTSTSPHTCGSFPQVGSLLGDVEERRKDPANTEQTISNRLSDGKEPHSAERHGSFTETEQVCFGFSLFGLLKLGGFLFPVRTVHYDVCRVLLSESCSEPGPLFYQQREVELEITSTSGWALHNKIPNKNPTQ